jgi:hypothetical protein
MSAFEKFKSVIAAEGKPDEIILVHYPDASAFARTWPGEDFDHHARERATIVAWCRDQGIKVIDAPPPTAQSTPGFAGASHRAEMVGLSHALSEEKALRYRLGIKLGGATGKNTNAYIGYAVIALTPPEARVVRHGSIGQADEP